MCGSGGNLATACEELHPLRRGPFGSEDQITTPRFLDLGFWVFEGETVSKDRRMQGKRNRVEENEEEGKEDEEVVMDADGRIAFDGSMDFGFRAWPCALPLRSCCVAHACAYGRMSACIHREVRRKPAGPMRWIRSACAQRMP